MKSPFEHKLPEGRRPLFWFVQRLDPAKPLGFPYEPVVAEPARWPAGERWERRRRLAAPLRDLARAIRARVDRMLRPLDRLATMIEGQPLVWWCVMDGWHERHGYRDGRTSWWVYEGEITPPIRQMFAAHPERFADCSPELLQVLGGGE